MLISAVQTFAGSHQQSGEYHLGSPWLAGGDPSLCKKTHLNLFCVILSRLWQIFISALLSMMSIRRKASSLAIFRVQTTKSCLITVFTVNNFKTMR